MLAAALSAPPLLAVEQDAESLHADYEALQEWQFSSDSVSVPAEGLHWQIDTATWHLDSGSIWLQRPTGGGVVTGFVFEGSGRFQMEVPDPVELRQLKRFAQDPELTRLEEEFNSLVVRGVRMPPMNLLDDIPTGPFSSRRPAKDRHDHWFVIHRFDADARIMAALTRSRDSFVRIDMKTAARGWMTYGYDAARPEEIIVNWFNPSWKILESWLSLDRPQDRRPDGRPDSRRGSGFASRVAIDHVDISVDLTEYANESPRGAAKVRPLDAKIEASVRLIAHSDGDRSLQFFLHPMAKVEKVTDGEGVELPFVRDHLGKRSSVIDNKIYDTSLVVLLATPLVAGAEFTLGFEYEIELDSYAPGRAWYPFMEPPGAGLTNLHTASMTLTSRETHALRAMGQLQSEDVGEGRRRAVWTIDRPSKMITFVAARRSHEEVEAQEGVPEVRTFSSLGGYMTQDRVHDLGVDVSKSLAYFQELFDNPLPGEVLQTAIIPAAHGQAFEGLLHIGDMTILPDNVQSLQRFRAHEVAHEWWGHTVGWNGYRDQWLSEGFAEYSAMMYVEATVDKGDKYLPEMLKAASDELTGSIESSFSQFTRPGIPQLNRRAIDRIGPIGHGYRCRVGEAPTAYLSQAYKKGALVLHMLRMILQAKTGSDEAFVQTLRLFIDRFGGRSATTEDFAAVLAEVVPGDWWWFFDQWVYGAEIPTYLWSHELARSADGHILKLHVEQQDVGPEFKIAVPVRAEFGDDEEAVVLALGDGPSNDFEFTLDREPKRIVFNPDHAILARVKKKK